MRRLKYWILRVVGHTLSVVPVICETLASLPYDRSYGLLDKLRVTASAAVIITVVVLCLLKNVIKEKTRTPAPWMIACTAFILTAAAHVIADKLFYITLAWALGSLSAIAPYKLAERMRINCDARGKGGNGGGG